MENIMDFSFKSPEALQLKQKMRRWYYGGRDGAEAYSLMSQFNSLFSSNMILDVTGELLWTLAEQSPLGIEDSLRETLSTISCRHITGRSIRAYRIANCRNAYQFEKWQTDASSRIETVLDKIDEQMKRELKWNADNRMSLPSALVSIAGIGALALGGVFLFFIARLLIAYRSFHMAAMFLPSSWHYDPQVTLICLALLTLVTGALLFLLPRMVMTLCAGSFWIFYQKGRFRLRRKQAARLRGTLKAEGFGRYCEMLSSAARQLADLPPDAPGNQDPSRIFLEQAGWNKVFRHFTVRPISQGWNASKFYRRVEKCHVRSRLWIMILSAAVIFLREFLLDGTMTAFLQRLI